MTKTLTIEFEINGINANTFSEHYEMYTLYHSLWQIPQFFIEDYKRDIIDIIENDKEREWPFETIVIKILNHEYFLIYDSKDNDENPEQTYFYIKQEALWQAIRDFNKIEFYSKKYKRITISYDGNKVYFDIEPFETHKEEK